MIKNLIEPTNPSSATLSQVIAKEMLEDYPDLLTVQDLRKLTGLSEQTIRAGINNGDLPGCRIGRRLYVPKVCFIDYVENGGGLVG